MSITSLSSLFTSPLTQQSLQKSSNRLQALMASLVTGNRLTKASTDVAALAVATRLQSEVSALRQASVNVAQADSMLQVADGGVEQIGDILQRMQALAVQSNNPTLDQATRESINREFQSLSDEIDRLSGNTSFAGQQLLDGSLSNSGRITTDAAPAERATGSLDFNANIGAGQTVNINNVTLTEGVDFNAGGTVQQTIDNLAAALEASTDPRLSQASFERVGNSLRVTADVGGEQGNQFVINEAASTAAASFSVNGDQLGASGIFSLTGGEDGGLDFNTVEAEGSVTDGVLTAQGQQGASSTLTFASNSDIQAGDTLQIDDGNGGFATFTFVAGTPAASNEIQIGATLEETLENAAQTLEDYTGGDDFGVRQLDFAVNGNSLEITAAGGGEANDALGAPLDITLGTTGGTISDTSLNNAGSGGVDARGVTNEAFIGQIQGFSATFNGADSVTAQITVGGETYTAQISDTTPGADTTVRFTSEDGGFFDVELAGGNGQVVGGQSDADQFAARLDAAFAGLNFTQNRDVASFNGQGQLVGASLSVESDDFGDLRIEDINVTAGIGGTARLEFTVNGEVFRSGNGLGVSIGAGESVTLTSNDGRTLTFTNGNSAVGLQTASDASALQTSLENAVGLNGRDGISFQVGSSSEDLAQIAIGDLSTESLFGGLNLDLLSQAGAANAVAVLGTAIGSVTAARADLGAAQQSLNFAAANLESAIFNQDAARSVLADSDFAADSSALSQATLQQNVALAIAAQGNRLSPALLRLIS